jgi:hypothetical protein
LIILYSGGGAKNFNIPPLVSSIDTYGFHIKLAILLVAGRMPRAVLSNNSTENSFVSANVLLICHKSPLKSHGSYWQIGKSISGR